MSKLNLQADNREMNGLKKENKTIGVTINHVIPISKRDPRDLKLRVRIELNITYNINKQK